MIRTGVFKIGNIGASPLLEFLFDERAERENIIFRVFGTGSKMSGPHIDEAISDLIDWKHDLTLFVSPNASLAAPRKIVDRLNETGVPLIVISDSPAIKGIEELKQKEVGYIIITADPMIGARREFLDPTEMAVFNADIIKVLAGAGVLKSIQKIIDKVICDLQHGRAVLPFVIIDSNFIMENPPYNNSYSNVKALAAFKLAELVGKIDIEACFKVQEWKQYTTLTAVAHELLSRAAKLVEDARETDKCGDTLLREPHDAEGKLLKKLKLLEKPE